MMRAISTSDVTPALRALFRTDEPQAPRCFAVLDGIDGRGKIFVDALPHPRWAIVQEATDNSLYFGGQVDAAIVRTAIAQRRREGDVLIGFWLDDPRMALLPPEPDYDGRTLEFYARPVEEGLEPYLENLPERCELHRLDRELILRTEWGPEDVNAAGGLDVWEKTRFGYCLMRGDEILAEATVGQPALGLYEPGVFTQEAHRGKGCGTITAARLVQEIERIGGQTYWNCAKQNRASAAIARKLGYRVEKEYRCMVWEMLEN